MGVPETHWEGYVPQTTRDILEIGKEMERERIISLLESISFLEDYPPFNYTIVTKEALELIKGENK